MVRRITNLIWELKGKYRDTKGKSVSTELARCQNDPHGEVSGRSQLNWIIYQGVEVICSPAHNRTKWVTHKTDNNKQAHQLEPWKEEKYRYIRNQEEEFKVFKNIL